MKIVISIDLEKPKAPKDQEAEELFNDKEEGEATENFTVEEDPSAIHDQKIPSEYLKKFWGKEPKVTPPSKLGKKPDKVKKEKK